MKSFFNSKQAKDAIEKMYHDKLDELPITYEFQKIETTFGDTNIIFTGKKSNPPLVLIHGSNGCAPTAIEAMLDLEKNFSIYAIDVIGQPNLSAEVRPNKNDDTYGKWIFEILTRLNIREVILVGISFGGFISWKAMTFDSRRISKAFLIVPAGIANGNPLKVFCKTFLPMKLYKWRKQKKYVHQFLTELFTEADNFTYLFFTKVFLNYKIDFSPIPLIKKAEAKKITTPLYIIASENDLLFPGEKMVNRARKIFPMLQKVLLLEQSKHIPNQIDNERIIEFIKKKSS